MPSGVAIVAISRTAHTVCPCGQPSTIVVGETRSAGPKLTPQEPILFDQVCDRLPLSAVQPPATTPSTI